MERFYALPFDENTAFPIGSTVLVVEYRPPRTVLVMALGDD
ncbi:MAG TPA: hypothetical protein VF597_03125 [Candidatus Saccharimonadales bacterium]